MGGGILKEDQKVAFTGMRDLNRDYLQVYLFEMTVEFDLQALGPDRGALLLRLVNR